MAEEKKCRKCLLREAFPADYDKYVASVLRTLSRAARADDAVCARRLDVCRTCGHLSNATCMGCGCLVEIRAAQKARRCPFQKWPE